MKRRHTKPRPTLEALGRPNRLRSRPMPAALPRLKPPSLTALWATQRRLEAQYRAMTRRSRTEALQEMIAQALKVVKTPP